MNDRDAHAYAAFPREQIHFYCAAVPINQATQRFGTMRPYGVTYPAQPPMGQMWQLENFQVFCTATVANANVRLQAGAGTGGGIITNSVIPVAGSVVSGTINPLPTPRRWGVNDYLMVYITTDGTGTITNLLVTATIRPHPMVGDA